MYAIYEEIFNFVEFYHLYPQLQATEIKFHE